MLERRARVGPKASNVAPRIRELCWVIACLYMYVFVLVFGFIWRMDLLESVYYRMCVVCCVCVDEIYNGCEPDFFGK